MGGGIYDQSVVLLMKLQVRTPGFEIEKRAGTY
jgi:hypothetical protein